MRKKGDRDKELVSLSHYNFSSETTSGYSAADYPVHDTSRRTRQATAMKNTDHIAVS